MDRSRQFVGLGVFLAALVSRLLGVTITTLTSLNTYAQADADRFAASAAATAATFANGQLPQVPTDPDQVVSLWGLFLSPIWLLPGPNRLYARLVVALTGALAVYALYRLTVTIHSQRAGVVAATPLVVYPSFVFVHSTILREAFVLAGLIGATYLLAGEPRWPRRETGQYALAVVALATITVIRWENLPIYLLVLVTAVVVRFQASIPSPRVAVAFTTAGAISGGWLGRPVIRAGLGWLSFKRHKRSEGRTVYLPEFRPDTIPKAVVFAPIGAVYFLFTPFPWMVGTVADAVVFLEALMNLVAFVVALAGVPLAWDRSAPMTAALCLGFVIAVILYGLVNANVGTVVRQRQMVLWVVFLFAGVAVAERVPANRWPAWVR